MAVIKVPKNDCDWPLVFNTKSCVFHFEYDYCENNLAEVYNRYVYKWTEPIANNIVKNGFRFFMTEDLSAGVHVLKEDDGYTAVFINAKSNVYYSKEYPLSELHDLSKDVMAFIYASYCFPGGIEAAFPYREMPNFIEWLFSFGRYERPGLEGYVKHEENPSQLVLNYGSDLDVSKATKPGAKIIWHPKSKTTGDLAKEICRSAELNKDFECCLVIGDDQLKVVSTFKVSGGKITFNVNTGIRQIFKDREYTSKGYEMTVEGIKHALDKAIQAVN